MTGQAPPLGTLARCRYCRRRKCGPSSDHRTRRRIRRAVENRLWRAAARFDTPRRAA